MADSCVDTDADAGDVIPGMLDWVLKERAAWVCPFFMFFSNPLTSSDSLIETAQTFCHLLINEVGRTGIGGFRAVYRRWRSRAGRLGGVWRQRFCVVFHHDVIQAGA